MRILRRRQPEDLLQTALPGRAAKQVGAAYDVGHAERRIVDDHGELIGDQAIATPHDDITVGGWLGLLGTLEAVRPAQGPAIFRHAEAQCITVAG